MTQASLFFGSKLNLTRLLSLLFFLLFMPAVFAADESIGTGSLSSSVSPKTLQAKIKEVEASTSLDAGTRAKLVELYRLLVISELHEEINRRFAEADINIAFPQRDIHLDTSAPLDIRIHQADKGAPAG